MSANVVYSLCAYSKFDKDRNPILLIHDRKNGVFLLNLQTLEKSVILDKNIKVS